MNSQRGKASTQASKQRQPSKSKTNARKGQTQSARGPRSQASAPSAYATTQNTGQARVSTPSRDSTRIVHRELIGSVEGSSDFTVNHTFNINPGLSTSFPWLASQARSWEKYRFNSLRVRLYTRCGTSTAGSCMIAADYDSSDDYPSTETQLSSYHGTVEDAPWKDISFTFDNNRLRQERFIRDTAIKPSSDIRLSDVALLFIATSDGAVTPWSKIWIEYDVTLMNQQVSQSLFQSSAIIYNDIHTPDTLNPNVPFGIYAVTNETMTLTPSVLASNYPILTMSGLEPGIQYIVTTFIFGTNITTFDQQAFTGGAEKLNSEDAIASSGTNATRVLIFTATLSTAVLTLHVVATTISASQAQVCKVGSTLFNTVLQPFS